MTSSLLSSGKLDNQQILTMKGLWAAQDIHLGAALRLLLGEHMFYAIGTPTYHQVIVQIKAGVENQIGRH